MYGQWYWQWLPSGDTHSTHYPPCPLFFHLPAILCFFFSMYSLVIHKSSSGLRTAAGLIAFYDSESSVRVRDLHPAPPKSNKLFDLFAHMSDYRSINSRRPIISWVCDILYSQAASRAKNMCCVPQQHDAPACSNHTATPAAKEMKCCKSYLYDCPDAFSPSDFVRSTSEPIERDPPKPPNRTNRTLSSMAPIPQATASSVRFIVTKGTLAYACPSARKTFNLWSHSSGPRLCPEPRVAG